jgi:hypothetical protein
MKKIAAILLFVFAFVQAGPVVASLFSPHVSCFIADEEKGEDKTETDKKDAKKDFAGYTSQVNEFSHQSAIALHLAKKMMAPPCLEKLTPPPNFY